MRSIQMYWPTLDTIAAIKTKPGKAQSSAAHLDHRPQRAKPPHIEKNVH